MSLCMPVPTWAHADTHTQNKTFLRIYAAHLSLLKYDILGGRVDFGVRQKKHLVSAHLGKNFVHLESFSSSISGATTTHFTWL